MRPPATCHPDRPHKAFGLCEPCYRASRDKTPEGRERKARQLREWRAANPERHAESRRRQHLAKLYHLTVDEYDAMLAAQDGVCAICGDAPAGGRHLVVDHDHATGAVRGLLCDRCNPALNRVEIEGWCDKALAYLTRNEQGPGANPGT